MAVLTISREIAVEGTEIGRNVAETLGYEYWSGAKILEKVDARGETWKKWAEVLDNHCPTVWERYDWSFKGFAALLQSALLDCAVQGRTVLVGKGGNFLLRDVPFCLRVHLVGSPRWLARAVMRQEGTDEKTAGWLVEKQDRERSCFLHSLYGRNWEDPKEYDRVFNPEIQPVAEILSTLIELLKEREKLQTHEAMETLRLRARAARARARILTDPRMLLPTLEIALEGDGLVLRGIVHNPEEHRKLERAARELAGEVPLKCDLRYRQ